MPLSEIILIIMGLLTVAMIAASICKNLPIPYTVFLVIIGISLGSIVRNSSYAEYVQAFQLTPELVLFLFLPALIFESAFNLDARQLVKDIGPILSLAIPALLVSTGIIGTGLWWLIDMDIFLALLFGALISATDPVAVVALFKELGAPPRLTVLVEGESLLNDATAIVVFNIILGLLISGGFAASDMGLAINEFLQVFIGGVLVGALIGILLSELLFRLKAGLSSYLVMSIVLAYASFIVAEHILHVSGVMAVLSAAISLSIFGVSRVPQSNIDMVMET
jgi:monovalent cation:H+ antiporter, CPA1 family